MTREERIWAGVYNHYAKLEEAIKERGWECQILGVFLQGSQNYMLDEYSDEYMSDVDTKAIVVPSLKELINLKKYSETVILEGNEHIDVKDVKEMFTMFKKQNTSYIELLYTDYYLINPAFENLFKAVFEARDRICRLDPCLHARALMGSGGNKFKAMTNRAPHSEAVIDKFGYDPKELCHLYRYNEELRRYIAGEDYKSCLMPKSEEERRFLMRVKKGQEFSLEEAVELGAKTSAELLEQANAFAATFPPVDTEVVALLDRTLIDIMYESVRRELNV